MVITIFVGLLSFVIGIVFMTYGVVSILKRHRQLATSLSADGVITGSETEWVAGEIGGYFNYPLVQFKVPSGQEVSFRSSIGSSGGGLYSVGQRVKVLYDPRNPQEAEIDARTLFWLVPGCMLAMGLAFTIVGLFLSIVMTLVVMNQP